MTPTLLDYTRYLQFIASQSIFNRDDAEDVVSDVWLTIIRRRKPLPDDPRHAKRYLRMVLRWHLGKHLRSTIGKLRGSKVMHLGDKGDYLMSRQAPTMPIADFPVELHPLLIHLRDGGTAKQWRESVPRRTYEKQFKQLQQFLKNPVQN